MDDDVVQILAIIVAAGSAVQHATPAWNAPDFIGP
jgi:hypothetical protein